MTRRRRVDLDLAASGYLRGIDGRPRRVPGIEAPAEDALRAGIRVYWGSPEIGDYACAFPWSQVVILSPELMELEASVICQKFGHEVGHCLGGEAHADAIRWQREHYGDA